MASLASKRVVVTGGSGFLGRHVVAALGTRGCTVLVPRKAQYDLTHIAGVERMYADLRPDVVLHLAAVVGGIGANRDSPGRFFFENVILGALTMEQARLSGVEKFVGVGTICAYPKLAPVPFLERDLWNEVPRRDERAMASPRRCSWSRDRRTASNTASTRSTCCRSTSMGRTTTSIRSRRT
jgi:GDP-L-fucose synthase